MVKFLDLQAQYRSIRAEVDAAVGEVLASARFIGGPAVKAFEESFAAFVGVDHCVGVANGTDALEVALASLSLPAAGEVLLPANTFIATAEAVVRAGFVPVFCDVTDSHVLDVEDARQRVTSKTSAVIPVHLYGHPCDMDAVLALAEDCGLKVLEDCAQAHGALYKGMPVGSFGHAAAFSFYPGKNLGAYGDAGAIVTSDAALAKRVRMLANHGRTEKYVHEFVGRNSRMDALQAAVLSVKLRHLPAWNEHRRRVAQWYVNGLADCPSVSLPPIADWATPVFHLFVVMVPNRDRVIASLKKRGIETGVHYPVVLPEQPAFRSKGKFRAAAMASRLLSLPMGEHLSEGDVRKVCVALKEVLS